MVWRRCAFYGVASSAATRNGMARMGDSRKISEEEERKEKEDIDGEIEKRPSYGQ